MDVSESMTTRDEIGGQSRIEAVHKALAKCEPVFEEMRAEQNVNVVLYKFGPPDFNEATSRYEPGAPAGAKVREVVASGRLAHRRPFVPPRAADRAAVAAALAAVDLTERAGDDLGVLSGGQQQRVLIARALATEPRLLDTLRGVGYVLRRAPS